MPDALPETGIRTLLRSNFVPSKTDPSKWLYPRGDGTNLSVNGKTGQFRGKDEPHADDGASEGFILEGDLATVNTGGPMGAWSFLVSTKL